MFVSGHGKAVIFWITTLLALTAGTANAAATSIDFCWQTSYGRSAGLVGTDCPAGQHREGLNCYNDCPKGFESNRMGLCIQTCPGKGWRDDGGFCRKVEYRVSEYPWKFGDKLDLDGATARCETVYGKNSCETRGAVVVDKCQWGYEHILGFCRPAGDAYPNCNKLGFAGQFDLSCTKDSFFKTVHDTQCKDDYEKSGSLCYPSCGANATGDGPVCWVSCPANWVKCGAGCAKDRSACAANTQSQVTSVVDMAVSSALAIATGGTSTFLKESVKGLGQQFTQNLVQTVGKSGATIGAQIVDIAGYANSEGAMDPVEVDWAIAQKSLAIASAFDPTGVMGIVAAYAKPNCNVVPTAYQPPANIPTTTGGIEAMIAVPGDEFSDRFKQAIQNANNNIKIAQARYEQADSNLNYWKFEVTGYNQLNESVKTLPAKIDCIRGCKPKPPCYARRGEPRGAARRSGQVQSSDYQRRGASGTCDENLTPERFDEYMRAYNKGMLWQELGWSQAFLNSREQTRRGLEAELALAKTWIATIVKSDFTDYGYVADFGSYFEDDGGKFMAAVSRYISSPGLARQQFEDSKANLADAERALVGLQRQAANAAQLQAELRKRTATNDSRGVKNVSSKTIQWTPFDNPHRLNQISSGPDALYGRNATNQTWKYDYVKRAWTRLGGAASIVLSVAPDGKVWRLDTNKDGSNNNHIYFLNTTANKWERIAGGKLRLSAGPNVLWGSNTQGAIWRYQNSNWNKIPGAASDVSVDEQGVAWHLSQRKNSGGGYDLYKSKNDRAWDKIGSPPGGWTRISGGPNGLWAINPIGEVWLYRRGTKSYWEKMANKETAVYINAAAKGDVWIISAQGQISHWNL